MSRLTMEIHPERDYFDVDDIFNPIAALISLREPGSDREIRITFPIVSLNDHDLAWDKIASGVRAEYVNDEPDVPMPLVVVGVGMSGSVDTVRLSIGLLMEDESAPSGHTHYELTVEGGLTQLPYASLSGPMKCPAFALLTIIRGVTGEYALTDQYHVHHATKHEGV